LIDNIRQKIADSCDSIKELLLAKNESYGNSALEPVRVFSKSDITEQLKVRIDDKLSRISRGVLTALPTESLKDTIRDLIGYLHLLLIQLENEDE
jgi:hypothetical protein